MTTAVNRNPGRTPKASTQSIPTTPKARVRKRDRMRAAARSRRLGVSTITILGTAAIGALSYFGVRKLDAERMKADPAAKPIAKEIADRAGTTLAAARDRTTKIASDVGAKAGVIANDVKDRAQSAATSVSEHAAATVHELGKKTGVIAEDVRAETEAMTDAERRQA